MVFRIDRTDSWNARHPICGLCDHTTIREVGVVDRTIWVHNFAPSAVGINEWRVSILGKARGDVQEQRDEDKENEKEKA